MVTSVTTTFLSTSNAFDENEPISATLPIELNASTDAIGDKTVTWDSNTVDNEHMNKKSSKCCCIFTGKKTECDSGSEDESTGDDDGTCKHNKNSCKSK